MNSTLDDDKQLLARMRDLAIFCDKRGKPAFSDFLTPAQISVVSLCRELKKSASFRFFGGFSQAERCVAAAVPFDFSAEPEYPIETLKIETDGPALSHRDILGALMGLLIKREKLGDIVASNGEYFVVCSKTISDFIIQNLEKIGRNSVRALPAAAAAFCEPETEQITATVMSLRLDAIVSEGFDISRAKASEAIKQGLVSVNWTVRDSVSKDLSQGDSISFRGHGKIKLAEVGGLSKKGRTFITISKYI
ncbi:MAG: YlmH/Sll1252 family protein [Oscillospiraceae bacterium]